MFSLRARGLSTGRWSSQISGLSLCPSIRFFRQASSPPLVGPVVERTISLRRSSLPHYDGRACQCANHNDRTSLANGVRAQTRNKQSSAVTDRLPRASAKAR